MPAFTNEFSLSDLAVETTEEGLFANCNLVNTVDKSYSDEFDVEAYNPGDTIKVTLPPRSAGVNPGKALVVQATEKEKVSVTVLQWNIGREISSMEMKLEDRKFVERVLKPDVEQLTRFVEDSGFQAISSQMAMQSGSPGVAPANFRIWAQTVAKAQKMLIPADDELYVAIDGLTLAGFADNERKLFHPKRLIEEDYEEGRVQEAAGIGKFYPSMSLDRHVNGDASVMGAQVTGSPGAGTTIQINSVAAGSRYTKGSQFFIAGVNAVDPQTKKVLSFPQVFTLTQDCIVSGNAATLTFLPAIVLAPSSLQNVSAVPITGAYVTFYGVESTAYNQNLLYNKNAIILVGLPLPKHDNDSGRVSMKTGEGVSIRTVNFTDWKSDINFLRYDICFGWAVKRWQHIWRVWDIAETP